MGLTRSFPFDDELRLIGLAQVLRTVPPTHVSNGVTRLFAYAAAGRCPVSAADDLDALRRHQARMSAEARSFDRTELPQPRIRETRMRPVATLTPARRDTLRDMLLRAARAGQVDLGGHVLPNWAAIDGFLLDADVSAEDLGALDRADIDAVRADLCRRPSLRERCAAVVEWLDESGFVSALLVVGIILAVLWLWRAMLMPAHAAAAAEHETSDLAGLLVACVPFVVIALLLAAATRGEPRPAEDEAFGDTTGFREQGR